MLSRPDDADRPPENQPDEEHRPTYQVMVRHLAKFRDGAMALLHVLDSDRAAFSDASVAPAVRADEAAPTKSPLDVRIERHMGMVDRALE